MARKAIKKQIDKLNDLMKETDDLLRSDPEPPIDDSGLAKKALFRIDEVAIHFDVSRSTIYLWIDHGILAAEKYHGTIRIPRESIIRCRMNNRLRPLE